VTSAVRTQALRLLFFAVLSYGLLYFSYKYYLPDFGGSDFYAYYESYTHPLDFQAADPPFVFRQLSAVLVFLVWKAGIYYPTVIAFHAHGVDQRVFFAAILANYAALTACAVVVAAIAGRLLAARGGPWPLLAGALCYFAFSTQQAVLTGLTEGVSWLLLALGFLGYLNRSRATILVVLALSVLQRELIAVIFAVFAAGMLAFGRRERGFHGLVIAAACAAFAAYIALRLSGLAPPGHEAQMDPRAIIRHLLNWRGYLTGDVLFQVFLEQNLLIALAAVWAWLRFIRRRPAGVDDLGPMVVSVYAAALVLVVAGFGALSGPNSTGKGLALLTPIVAPLLVALLARAEAAPAAEAA
jgi:hypothetical protein